MSMSRTNAPYVVTRKVEVAKDNSKSYTDITAPSVSGYSFVCWCGAATVNEIGSPYIVDADRAETKVWDARKKGDKIQAVALYRRD